MITHQMAVSLAVMILAGAAHAKAPLFTDDVFVPAAEDIVIDRGTIDVPGNGPSARSETFVIVRKSDGGYAIMSKVAPVSGAYTGQGRWDYDAGWIAQRAIGVSVEHASGATRHLLIERDGPVIRMSQDSIPVSGEPAHETWSVPCGPECLMDLSPSILPMTVMGRRFDPLGPPTQTFRWVGIGLNQNAVLTSGTAQLSSVGETMIDRGDGKPALTVTHWQFLESLKDDVTGRTGQMHGHFWNDANGFPRKFGMGFTPVPTTIGTRVGDEAISPQMTVE